MKRKRIVIILVVSAVCVAALLVLGAGRGSVVGRWHQVGGGSDMMMFMGGGDMQVNESPDSYIWTDGECLRVEFGMGSPRLVWFSPRDGTMQWTNEQLGLVLRYTNEPGSFVTVGIGKALGL